MNSLKAFAGEDIARLVPPENVTKKGRILHSLGSGEKLSYRLAQKFGDSCLHSTVSSLRNNHLIEIQGKSETFKGFDGHPSRCHTYWVEPFPKTMEAIYRLLLAWGWRNPNDKIPAKKRAA